MHFQTIKEWLDELKEKFFGELQNVMDSNSELQAQNEILQSRLTVLNSVENQLKESVEDIEVEGTIITTSDLSELAKNVNAKSQTLWENIKSRLMHVMQRPYQLFSVREVSEEEQQFKLLNDKLLAEV